FHTMVKVIRRAPSSKSNNFLVRCFCDNHFEFMTKSMLLQSLRGSSPTLSEMTLAYRHSTAFPGMECHFEWLCESGMSSLHINRLSVTLRHDDAEKSRSASHASRLVYRFKISCRVR